MKTNSLALRLFVTAAAWVLVVLPVAGWIIFTRYRHEVVPAFDARIALFLTVVINDAQQGSEEGPTEPDYWGEGLFVQVPFRLVLADEAARRQAGRDPAIALPRRRLSAAARARTASSPTTRRCAGPTSPVPPSRACASPR